MKLFAYQDVPPDFYFWKKRGSKEIDLVEVVGGSIRAYEIKYSPKVKYIFLEEFLSVYNFKDL